MISHLTIPRPKTVSHYVRHKKTQTSLSVVISVLFPVPVLPQLKRIEEFTTCDDGQERGTTTSTAVVFVSRSPEKKDQSYAVFEPNALRGNPFFDTTCETGALLLILSILFRPSLTRFSFPLLFIDKTTISPLFLPISPLG